MSWVDEYARQLAGTYNRRAQLAQISTQPGVSPWEISRQVSQTRPNKINIPNMAPASNNKRGGVGGLFDSNWDDAKALINLLGIGIYPIAGGIKEVNDLAATRDDKNVSVGEFGSKFGKGFKEGIRAALVNKPEYDEDRVLFSELWAENRERAGRPVSGAQRFIGGLALDILGDPLTYVGAGPVVNAGRRLGLGSKASKTENTAERALDSQLDEAVQTNEAVVPTGQVDNFYKRLKSVTLDARNGRPTLPITSSRTVNSTTDDLPFEVVDREPILFGQGDLTRQGVTPLRSTADDNVPIGRITPLPNQPRALTMGPGVSTGFAASAAGEVSPTLISGADVANAAARRAQIQSVNSELGQIPVRRYPRDLEIDPIYREITTQVPKTVDEEVIEMVTLRDPSTPAADDLLSPLEKPNVAVNRGDKRKTIYRALMTRPDHVIRVGQNEFTVRQLQDAVRENPARQKSVDTVLRGEAERLSGLHMDRVREALDMPRPKAEPGLPRLEERRKIVKKQIMEDVTRFERFSPAEKMAWRQKYEKILDPEDLTYILRAPSVNQFKSRAAKVLAKPKSVGFAKTAHMMQAIRAGLVDPKDVERLMKLVGAKKVEDIPAKIEKLIIAARKAEDKIIKSQRPKKTARKRAAKTATPSPAAVSNASDESLSAIDKQMSELDELINKVERAHSPQETVWDVNPSATPLVSSDEIAKARLSGAEDYWANRPKVRVTPEQQRIMGVVGNESSIKNFVDPAKWPFQTRNTRARRTSNVKWEGKARNLRGWNSFAQSDIWRGLLRESSGRFAGKAGYPRNAEMYKYIMPMLEGLEETFKSLGVMPVLGKGQRGLPLGLHDILAPLPRDLVIKHVVDNGRGMFVTRLAEAVEIVVEHGLRRGPYASYAEARAAVREFLDGPIPRQGRAPLEDNWHKYLRTISPEDATQLVDDFTDALFKATPQYVQRLEINSGLAKVQLGEQVQKLTDDVINGTVKAYQDPAVTPGDRLEIISAIPKTITEAARRNGASAEAETVARTQIEIQAAETIDRSQVLEAKNAKAMAGAKSEADANRVSTRHAESVSDEIAEEFPELPIAERLEMSMLAQVRRSFDPHYRVGQLRNDYNAGYNSNQAIAREFAEMAARVSLSHSPDSIRAAFSAYMRGATEEAIEEVGTQAALKDMRPMLDSLFDANKDFNIFSRVGITGHQINRWMRHFGIKEEKYALDEKLRGGDLIDQIRQWEDIDDPLDFMSRFHSALRQVATLRAVGSEFSRLGSARPGKGLYKVRKESYRTEIGPYIDFSRFYSKEQIEQLSYFNKYLGEAQKTVNNQIVQWYDSFLHMYKSGLTIYRPGHHLRNMVGDASLSFLAGVTNPKYAGIAMKAMTRHRATYRDLDFAQKWDAIQTKGTSFGQAQAGKLSDKAVTVRLANGRTANLSYDAFWNYAHQQGLLPSYTVLEDISFDTSKIDALPRRLRKPLGGRAQRIAAGVSTGRDHFVRLTDFAHHLENTSKSAKSLEEAVKEAARLTRKWHPDGSDLTHFEKRVMRRTMTFYSWIRKAIPLVAESIYTRPGRVLVYPKAYYNFAEANGIDLNSFTNPFPTDQLFPSWLLADQTGPLYQSEEGEYMGINPGVTSTDVMNDYFAGPETAFRQALGSTIPFIKAPYELATGHDVRTGAQINDWSEYADRQIPFVTMANSAMNASPTGSIASLLPGGNPAGLDQHRSVIRGYEEPGVDETALVNLLSGLGQVNMSRPNYQRQRQFEFRDEIRRRRDQAVRANFNG